MELTTSNRSIGKKAFITFFVIVILFSAVVETMICRGGSEWLYMVLMWIPAASCIELYSRPFGPLHAITYQALTFFATRARPSRGEY